MGHDAGSDGMSAADMNDADMTRRFDGSPLGTQGNDENRPTRREHERTMAGRRRAMRRADREVTDTSRIGEIIARCDIVHVAYEDAEGLAVVPLNLAYEYDDVTGALILWFHSASRGRKIDAMRAAGNALSVAFAMEADCEVTEGRTLCNWGEAFASVAGTGTASLVADDDLDARRKALTLLMAQAAHIEHAEFTDAQVRSVAIWKVTVDHLTCKVRPKPSC